MKIKHDIISPAYHQVYFTFSPAEMQQMQIGVGGCAVGYRGARQDIKNTDTAREKIFFCFHCADAHCGESYSPLRQVRRFYRGHKILQSTQFANAS